MIQKIKDNRKVVLIDMDNTINKFWIGTEETYNLLFFPKIHIRRKDLKEYQILPNIINIDETENARRMQRIFEHENFWLNQPVYDNAIEVIKKINEVYNVYIVTSPWTSAINCYIEKVKWIKNNFSFLPLEKLIFTRDKWLIKCDYIIDDAPFYLERDDCKKIAIDYEYNKNVNVDFRSENWKDIAEYLGV